jgi:hypothetical protein
MAGIDRTKRAKDYFKPRAPGAEIVSCKELFDKINRYVTAHGGWITSIPGAAEVSMETLPDSTLPDELRTLGYDVTEIGEGQRILPHTITQRLTLTSSGAFELLTEGSTKPVAEIRTHAGIARVMRFALSLV